MTAPTASTTPTSPTASTTPTSPTASTASTASTVRAAGDEPVAWVDQTPVTLGQVRHRLELIRAEVGEDRMPAAGSPEDRRLRRWVVQTLVDELLVEDHARAIGVTVRRRAGEPMDDAVALAVFASVVADVRVDDAPVRDHYERNRARHRRPERRRVDLSVVTDEAAAVELAATAARPGGLRGAARDRGIVVEAHDLERGAVGGRLEELLFADDAPAIVGPVRTRLGWHVVEVRGIVAERTEPFERVRELIRDDLLEVARGERFDTWLLARRRDHARFLPGHGHPGDPRLPDSIHRH